MRGYPSLPARGLRLAGTLMVLTSLIGTIMLAGSASGAPAIGFPGGNGSFSLSPAPGANGRAAPYFMLRLAPGKATTAAVVVTNEGHTKETLRLSRAAGITASNGGSAFSGAFHPCSATACWLTGLPSAITLAGGAKKELGFRVRVPAMTPPKQYLAGITAEIAARPKPVAVGSHGHSSGQAIIVRRATIAVAVTVGRPASLRTVLHIKHVSGAAISTLPRLNIVLLNAGQTFAHAAGGSVCSYHGRLKRDTVYADTVLPGDQAVIPADALGLSVGTTVPCTVRLAYGRGQVTTWTGMVTFPGRSRHLVRVGPGDYASLPSHGIPAWAIGLMALGGLLLVAVIVLILRQRRYRHAGY